jgi:hypothetical protein
LRHAALTPTMAGAGAGAAGAAGAVEASSTRVRPEALVCARNGPEFCMGFN